MPVTDPRAVHLSHDAFLIAKLADDDLTPSERTRADERVATCAECARLLNDLRAIATATASLPAPARSRDFRLTDADAARLRPSGWRGWARQLGSPRFAFVRPVGSLIAVLGLAGVLLSAGPGLVPGNAPTSRSAPDGARSQVSDGTAGAGGAAPVAGQAQPYLGSTTAPTAGPSSVAGSAAPSVAVPQLSPAAPAGSVAPPASAAPPVTPGSPVPAPTPGLRAETSPLPPGKLTPRPTPRGAAGPNPMSTALPPPPPGPTVAPTSGGPSAAAGSLSASAPASGAAVAPAAPAAGESSVPSGPAGSTVSNSSAARAAGGPSPVLIFSVIVLVAGGALVATSLLAQRLTR